MKTLSERDRRLFAGFLSRTLWYGGDKKIAEITGLDLKTVHRGRNELVTQEVAKGVRRPGGGNAIQKKEPILETLGAVVAEETAGEPMGGQKWVRHSLRPTR